MAGKRRVGDGARWIGLAIAVLLIIGAIALLNADRASGPVVREEVQREATTASAAERIEMKRGIYEPAIELVTPDRFINTGNITLSGYIGEKVILIDFWTYSCINCIRTIPHLRSWHERYADQGLLIIGVHTPEFEFEKEYDNVLAATEKHGITWPVVQDNQFQTWRAYQNRYWPRKYLIDIDGFIVYDHIGEGAYDETESEIVRLLEERARVLGEDLDLEDADAGIDEFESTSLKTPELYLGHGFRRNNQLGNIQGWDPDQTVEYAVPETLIPNKFYLEGFWSSEHDGMRLASGRGSIYLEYFAKQVNIVAGSQAPAGLDLYRDGEFVRTIDVEAEELYTLIDDDQAARHTIELRFEDPGVTVYTFTFG